MKKSFLFLAFASSIAFAEIFEFVNRTTECIAHFNSFNGELEYSKECNYREKDDDFLLLTCYFNDEKITVNSPNYARIWHNEDGPQFSLYLFNGKKKDYNAKKFTEDLRKNSFRKCDFHYEAHIQKAVNDF